MLSGIRRGKKITAVICDLSNWLWLPASPGLSPHGGFAVGVGGEVVAVEPVAGVDLPPSVNIIGARVIN
jgi:hypothetical protein